MDFSKKAAITWGASTVVGLYTTFVLQSLWNWFVVPAANLPSISFWLMFGLNSFLGLLLSRDAEDAQDERRWTFTFAVLPNCVQPEKADLVKEELQGMETGIWANIGLRLMNKVFGNTVTLGIGWAVHELLL